MNLRYFPLIMLKCLICTILIECIVAFVIKVRDKKDFINIILVNILTNPLVVSISTYINIIYGLAARNKIIILLEISAVLIEGFIYKKTLKNKHPYRLSLILNLASYLIGKLINYI